MLFQILLLQLLLALLAFCSSLYCVTTWLVTSDVYVMGGSIQEKKNSCTASVVSHTAGEARYFEALI